MSKLGSLDEGDFLIDFDDAGEVVEPGAERPVHLIAAMSGTRETYPEAKCKTKMRPRPPRPHITNADWSAWHDDVTCPKCLALMHPDSPAAP